MERERTESRLRRDLMEDFGECRRDEEATGR